MELIWRCSRLRKLQRSTGPVYGKLGEKALLLTGSRDKEFELAGKGKMSIIDSKTNLEYNIRQRFVNELVEILQFAFQLMTLTESFAGL